MTKKIIQKTKMKNIEESPLFQENERLFTLDPLVFGLEERSALINKHKTELLYVCKQLRSFKWDVEHIIDGKMPLSMISNLAYNLVNNLVSCYVGLTIYDYLTTSYLLSDNYNDNYRLWRLFAIYSKDVEHLIERLEVGNIFNIDEFVAIENMIPPTNMQKNAVRSLLNLEHMLSKMNGYGLFHALVHYLRAIEDRLERIKTDRNNLSDDDFETIYTANYNYYKEHYWPTELKRFRPHIEEHYLHRSHDKVETLVKLLLDDKYQFEQDGTGALWRDYFHDKKTLYFEMRKANINEEQWKYFFKNICKFEEYEKWIDELENPVLNKKEYPNSAWDRIFKDAIDLSIVKPVLATLLPDEPAASDWFVVHKIFEEIDWLQDEVDTHFISWVDDIYGWPNKAKDFKRIQSEFKKKHTLDWDARTITSSAIALKYKGLADTIRSAFVTMEGKRVISDNKRYFKRKDLYISHDKIA